MTLLVKVLQSIGETKHSAEYSEWSIQTLKFSFFCLRGRKFLFFCCRNDAELFAISLGHFANFLSFRRRIEINLIKLRQKFSLKINHSIKIIPFQVILLSWLYFFLFASCAINDRCGDKKHKGNDYDRYCPPCWF